MSSEPPPAREPWPDRITLADRIRFAIKHDAAASDRHALLVRNAPLWMRLLARLPNPKRPLENWIATSKARLRNRL